MILASRNSIKQDLLAYGEVDLAKMIDNLTDSDLNKIGEMAVKHIGKGGYLSKTIVYGAIEFLEGKLREPKRKKRDLSVYKNDTVKDDENTIARFLKFK
jgi:hypothetical protein